MGALLKKADSRQRPKTTRSGYTEPYIQRMCCDAIDDKLTKRNLERKRALDKGRRERAVRRKVLQFTRADRFAGQGQPRGGRFKQGETHAELGTEAYDIIEV